MLLINDMKTGERIGYYFKNCLIGFQFVIHCRYEYLSVLFFLSEFRKEYKNIIYKNYSSWL